MSGQHTPGRLTVRDNGDANSYALLDDRENWFMSVLMNGEQLTATQQANARRLAACWNACKGVATEALEDAGALAAGTENHAVAYSQLVSAQRELAAARALYESTKKELGIARAIIRGLIDDEMYSGSLWKREHARNYLDAVDTLEGGAT